jgi:hypothetical protein
MADETKNLQSPGSAHQEHPLFSGAQSVGMISGENPRFPAQASGHEAMGEALKQMGVKAEPRDGRYGSPEKSWMLYGPTREQMYQLGKQFGQESVVFSPQGNDAKRHELLYTNGPNAGRFHPALDHEFFGKEPEDYYTHMPELGGYLRLNFDFDTLHPTNLNQVHAVQALQDRAAHGQPPAAAAAPAPVTKAEIATALTATLKKALGASLRPPRSRSEIMKFYSDQAQAQKKPAPHPHSYPWHNEHTDHHLQVAAPGVVLRSSRTQLQKAMPAHPHMDGSKPPEGTEHLKPVNDQAAGVGTSTYAHFAVPYGHVDKSAPTDLFHYPYHGKNQDIDRLVKDHGFTSYYAGGKYGRPDLANRNYNTKHLMIYDPSPGSGGDFGTEAYTDGWRKIHELSHALTYPELNNIYGEGRRIGKLGQHRTLREGLRAVHWEWLAAHKQRELSQQIGVHVPDHVFHKELNTVMHDAIHRAVTGKFTEPSGEGFRPHEHKLPLETALGMVRESAHNLGITGMHDLIKKAEGTTTMDDKVYEPKEWRQALAKAVKERVDAYSKTLLELRQRELKKNLGADPALAGPAPEMTPLDKCPLCGMEDVPGKCKCLQGPLAGSMPTPALKNEDCVTPPDTSLDKGEFTEKLKADGAAAKAKGKILEISSEGRKEVDPSPKPTGKCARPGCKNAKTGTTYCSRACSMAKTAPLALAEKSAKAKEPIKPAKGNGVKITSLKLAKAVPMSGMGKAPAGAGAHAAADAAKAAPKPGAAAPVKLPGAADQAARQATFAAHMPKPAAPAAAAPKLTGMDKIKAAGSAPMQAMGAPKLPGMGAPKPAAPAAAAPKLPGMGAPKPVGAPAPAAGVGHLKGPPAPGAAAPKPAGMPKPAAAPKAAAPAMPKPAAPAAPKAPAPGGLGKSTKSTDDLKKALGSCVLCNKAEHSGQCS